MVEYPELTPVANLLHTVQADAVLLMFDLTNRISFKNALLYARAIGNTVPFVLAGKQV